MNLTFESANWDWLQKTFPVDAPWRAAPSQFPWAQWNMERDDGPIFAQIIRHLKPLRHLEFGTWKGYGSRLVLEKSLATVWTINLREGESHADGTPAYPELLPTPKGAKNIFWKLIFKMTGRKNFIQTDAFEQVGSLVHRAGLGTRLNQIYCDSTQWVTTAYPDGFFDSILIDGGHQAYVVASDTLKSIRLVREGGVILWHDFCPVPGLEKQFPHLESVRNGINEIKEKLAEAGIRLFWLNPSWFLIGIKGNAPIPTAKS